MKNVCFFFINHYISPVLFLFIFNNSVAIGRLQSMCHENRVQHHLSTAFKIHRSLFIINYDTKIYTCLCN